MNASYPFRFNTPKRPAGDVTLVIEASVPWPHTWHHYLRVRLTEADGRTLGHVFSSPDCTWQCQELYPDNDPTMPLIDTVRIPEELAAEWMADGALELAIEIDVARKELSCALHPEHERCFPFLASGASGNEGQVNALFAVGASSTHLSQIVAVGDTTINVNSAAAAGLTAALFKCPPDTGPSTMPPTSFPPCKAVNVQVCTPTAYQRTSNCELVQVCVCA